MRMTSLSATISLHKTKSGICAAVFCVAVFCVAPLSAWAKSWTFVANSVPNETGGVLYVSGVGWAKTGNIVNSVTNPPDQKPGTYRIGTAYLYKSKFSTSISWDLNAGSCPIYSEYVYVLINATGPPQTEVGYPDMPW